MGNETSSLLSVVIVARNEEKNIARCIGSILKNVPDGTEILLVDSASTDRMVQIASEYPVNIISLKREWPLSPAAGRFSGVNNVTGEYVLIIDGDMELLPGWIQEALLFMKTHPMAASVVGRHYDIWETPKGIYRGISRSSLGINKMMKVEHIFCSSLFRREFLLKVGNFQPYLRAEEEAEASYRLLLHGYDLYALPIDSINHYSIPRHTLEESIRRSKKNLWAGMGDMFSWGLRNGYYRLLWQRFRVQGFFILLIALFMSGVVIGFITANVYWSLGGGLLAILFVIMMCVKKRSVGQGLLGVTNIACISWSLLAGVARRVPDIKDYPRDVVWVKKVTEIC